MSTPAVEISNLHKFFSPPFNKVRRIVGRSSSTVHALRGLSMKLYHGEIFGLVGRNGYGKTTLIKSIASLIQPSSGKIRVHGFDTVKSGKEVRRRIGLVSADERTFYWRLTGKQNLDFFARLHGIDSSYSENRIKQLSKEFGLEDLLDRRFYEYSSGNKQRLAIVRALLADPPLIILDEPTRSLDPIVAEHLRQHIVQWAREKPPKTVLLTTHNLEEIVQISDRIGIMSRGKLWACGTLNELRAKHGDPQRVELTIRTSPTKPSEHPPQQWFDRQPEPVSLEFRRVTADIWTITFPRQRSDRLLDLAIATIRENKAEVVDCRTQSLDILDLLDRAEAISGPDIPPRESKRAH